MLRAMKPILFTNISLFDGSGKAPYPGEVRVRTARSFQAWEGGGEYNVARGLRRCFGLRTAVATALADNEVGRLIEGLILHGGVDTSLLQWQPDDGVGRRVRLIESDYFSALRGERYDIIVSNPPYVGTHEMRSLPPEYRHEPRLALASGRDGMDAVRVILEGAGRHLNPGGILIVEVGNTAVAVRRRFARLPFTWLTFERGGGGVFVLTAEQLASQGS